MCWSELAILFHSSSWVSPLRLQWCLTAWIWTSYYRIPFLSFFFSPLTVKIIKLERDFLDEHLGTEWGEMGFKLEEGRFKTDMRNKLYTVWEVTGTGCPVKLCIPPPWRQSRPGWMKLWATWPGGRCPCLQKGVGTRRS